MNACAFPLIWKVVSHFTLEPGLLTIYATSTSVKMFLSKQSNDYSDLILPSHPLSGFQQTCLDMNM